MVLNILQCPGQPPRENNPAQDSIAHVYYKNSSDGCESRSLWHCSACPTTAGGPVCRESRDIRSPDLVLKVLLKTHQVGDPQRTSIQWATQGLHLRVRAWGSLVRRPSQF